MPIERVVLASFAPDADTNNPALIEDSDNVFPTLRGFKNFPDPATDIFPALPNASPPHGTFMGLDFADSARLFAVTSSNTVLSGTGKIYEASGMAAWDDVTPDTFAESGAVINIEVPRNYRAQFTMHNDVVLYVDGDTGYCKYDPNGADTKFVRLNKAGVEVPVDGTELPAARFVVSTGEHVVLFNFSTGTSNMGVNLNETSWWCSNAGTYNLFDDDKPSESLSNASYINDTPGVIIGAKAFGKDIIVYKERSVHRLQWNGQQAQGIFANVLLSNKAGALSNEAVVDIGDRHIFMGYDDIYEVSGGSPRSVNHGVREFLFGTGGNLDQEFAFATQGYFDRARNIVTWFYPIAGDDQRGRDPDDPIVCRGSLSWNIATDKWTHGTSGLGDKNVVQVVMPEIIPAGALGFTYGDFGTRAAADYGGGNGKWATNFQENSESVLYAQASMVGVNEFSPAAFVATVASSPTFGGISGFTVNSSYGDATSTGLQAMTGSITTGSFGDGINYSFVRAIKPRFVGRRVPTSVELVVWAKEDLDISIDPEDDSYYFFYSIATEVLRDSGGSLSLYDNSTGNPTPASTPTVPSSPIWFPVRASGRYLQFVFSFKGEAELMGFDIDYDTAGIR